MINKAKRRPKITAAAVAALLVLIWVVWPESYSHVENLDSRGSVIIAFGDSLTAGYGAGNGEDYPSKVSTKTGIPIANAGVSGDTTAMALDRLDEDVLSRDPRVVIVGLGGNDYLQSVPIGITEANLRTIISEIQQQGAMVVLLGFRFPSLDASYGPMYERVAEEEGALYIPDMLDGILGDPSLKSDSVHPNARGYEIMAERVEDPLVDLLDAADSAR
ncbi:MAG: arylesterase [Thermoanaerobaculia bacterium]|nr:arylesterase [Thermoanaerobaculia bacterium]